MKDKGQTDTPLEADWLGVARQALVEGGVAAVEINRLAARLNVTRGGFYWRFRNRAELLEQLLADWHNTNTLSLLRAVAGPGAPRERYAKLVSLWIDEKDFDPALDTAVRQWGSIDPAVQARVHTDDVERLTAITSIFQDAGKSPEEAMVRSRVVYFHQVGYYTLGIRETRARRLSLAPIYDRVLADFD